MQDAASRRDILSAACPVSNTCIHLEEILIDDNAPHIEMRQNTLFFEARAAKRDRTDVSAIVQTINPCRHMPPQQKPELYFQCNRSINALRVGGDTPLKVTPSCSVGSSKR